MKTNSTFTDASWDFSTIWARSDNKNGGYPYLQFQSFPNSSVVNDGSSFSNSPTPGQTNQSIGRFALSSINSGSIFDYIWITLNGTRSGASNFKLWVSDDNAFDSGIDTQIGTTVIADPGDGNQIWFSALSQSLSASDKYYFLTCDLTAGATGSIQALISSDKDLLLGNSTANSSIANVSLSTNPIPLPVELTSFTANVNNNKIELNWQTSTEVNNYGFEIERLKDSKIEKLNVWQKVGFVNGHGNSNSVKLYSFTDDKVTNGNYSYRLKQIDINGNYEYSKAVEVSFMKPTEFSLGQNYPNPFNPVTTIKFSLPIDEKVVLEVYNTIGQKVATLINQEMSVGYHEANFDASKLTSGIYIYKLNAGSLTSTKKMILMK